MNESTSIHKIGHISANYGPNLKIQNLAYSGVRARSGERDDNVASDATCAMTSLLWQQSLFIAWLLWAYLANRLVDFAHFRQAN